MCYLVSYEDNVDGVVHTSTKPDYAAAETEAKSASSGGMVNVRIWALEATVKEVRSFEVTKAARRGA